ncbi:MAG: pyruvate carboxyltransferase [Peptococcaceae bacterium]|jgi:hydroxymethylglutaryl-CoA lyase|nr:pyruvate carboxyltransferase [Peptococcaceae bacterium]
MDISLPKKVTMTELLARDGFQHESWFVPTDTKVYFIDRCSELGFKCVEVTNFSHPRNLPQFKDAEEVLKRIKRVPGVTYKCYGMSDKAIERAVKAKEAGYGPDVLAFTISTTESHSRRNAGKSTKEFLAAMPGWIKSLHAAGIKANMAIAGVFGCSIEGPVPMETTFEYIERGLEMGIDEATPCDTTGEASPDRVYRFYGLLREKFPGADVHMAHFHDSRGMAMANYLAAMMAGVTHLESSLGQLGGQPAFIVDGVPGIGTGHNYTPSDLVGNAATEDLVVMLDEMGIESGVDVEQVLETGRVLERCLGRDLRPYCTKTGRIPKCRTNWCGVPPFSSQWWANSYANGAR